MKAADNRLSSVISWLKADLEKLYDHREAANISHILIEDIFTWSRSEQLLRSEHRLSEGEMLLLVQAKDELLKGVPYQYVIGFTYFYDLKFKTNSNVLIPRPETEELVNSILNQNDREGLRVLDIGTGSGCIPIAIKHHKPEWEISACDVSDEALHVARENAELNELKVHFFNCDILNENPKGQWDIIVSNPPYIPESESDSMLERVKDHEPKIALFVPDHDPLLFYKRIAAFAEANLSTGAQLWFEIHEDLAQETAALFTTENWSQPLILRDLQGKERMLFVSKR